jgi:arylsulfatase A-like enzyme
MLPVLLPVLLGLGAVLGEEAAKGSCNTTSAYCYANRPNIISTHSKVGLGACCDLCQTTAKCASFSHWGGTNETGPANCFLFSTVSEPTHSLECSSGTTGRAPSPAPPGPRPHPPPTPPSKPSGKNFVLFVAGAVRAESLGTYGHPVTKSPAFDRLAAQGTLFQQAHSVSPSTSPSRIAIATGRYVHTKNHRTTQHLVQTWESNLFGLLHDEGYYVAFFGKNYMLSADSLQNVDFWAPEASAANDTAMLEFLANPPKQPFVMLVSPPGANYEGDAESGGAPPAFGEPGYYSYFKNGGSMYDYKKLEADAPLRRAQPAASKKPAFHSKMRSYRKLDTEGSEFFYQLNAAYLHSITQDIDGLLGKLLDALAKDVTLDQNTAVIASAEAGDFAGDFGLVNTWAGGLDDVLTRVPFVARIPGGAKGHVVQEQISLPDLFPTVLELSKAGPSHTKNTHFGQSLVPQLMGAAGDPTRIIYAEAGFLYPVELEPLHSGGPQLENSSNPRSMEYPRRQEELEGCPTNVTLRTPNFKGCLGSPRATMARTLTHKLVYRAEGDLSELYDLSKDPRELKNLWNSEDVASVQKHLLGEMLQWYQETSDTTDWQVKTGRGAPKMGTDGYPVNPRLPKGERDIDSPVLCTV